MPVAAVLVTVRLRWRRVVWNEPAEASCALTKGKQRLVDVLDIEVGPVDRQEAELGVGALPEQEVREPHLAGRANDEIGIGQPVREEAARERLLVDLIGRDALG